MPQLKEINFEFGYKFFIKKNNILFIFLLILMDDF